MSLRERDVVIAGLLEDPTVAASLLSNCLSTAQAGSAEMKQLFSLSVPSTVSTIVEGRGGEGNRREGAGQRWVSGIIPPRSHNVFDLFHT